MQKNGKFSQQARKLSQNSSCTLCTEKVEQADIMGGDITKCNKDSSSEALGWVNFNCAIGLVGFLTSGELLHLVGNFAKIEP